MSILKSLKGFGMLMIDALIEARKARAEAVRKGIGR